MSASKTTSASDQGLPTNTQLPTAVGSSVDTQSGTFTTTMKVGLGVGVTIGAALVILLGTFLTLHFRKKKEIPLPPPIDHYRWHPFRNTLLKLRRATIQPMEWQNPSPVELFALPPSFRKSVVSNRFSRKRSLAEME